MEQMKKSIFRTTFIAAVTTAACTAAAANMITGSDGDDPRVFFTDGNVCVAAEAATVNNEKCAGFVLKKIAADKSGNKTVGGKMLFGGDRKNPGVAVKPDTEYKFSFNYCGNSPAVFFSTAQLRNGSTPWYSRVKYIPVTPRYAIPSKEWKQIKGTFKTAPDTVRVALVFEFWGSSKAQGKRFDAWQEGQAVYVDKIVIEEITAE